MAFVARTLCQTALAFVLFASNIVFTLFLRVLIFPLLVAAAAGDGMAWLISRLADRLPLPAAKRAAWRDLVDRRWSGLRQRMSHKAGAVRAQSALQGGISLVFQKCA